MARLTAIVAGAREGTQVLRLILDHYDLHNYGGMLTREAAERLARMATANAKVQFSWQGASQYSFFYREWSDERNAIHREAELEVTVA